MLKLSSLISVRADAVQKNYIYLFEIRNTTESAGGLAKSHCAVKGTFCGCTDRFTAQMFINRGNISEPQYQPTTRYIYECRLSFPARRSTWTSAHICSPSLTLPPLRHASNFLRRCSSSPSFARTRRPQRHTERSGVNMVIGGGDWWENAHSLRAFAAVLGATLLLCGAGAQNSCVWPRRATS